MTTVLYISRGHLFNDVYASEDKALASFGLYATSTIVDVISGGLTGREMRRRAKAEGVKLGG